MSEAHARPLASWRAMKILSRPSKSIVHCCGIIDSAKHTYIMFWPAGTDSAGKLYDVFEWVARRGPAGNEAFGIAQGRAKLGCFLDKRAGSEVEVGVDVHPGMKDE